jgi:hypothetical protein
LIFAGQFERFNSGLDSGGLILCSYDANKLARRPPQANDIPSTLTTAPTQPHGSKIRFKYNDCPDIHFWHVYLGLATFEA